MNLRAQTTVELLLLLAVSLLALLIIYSIYANQLDVSIITRERASAKSTLESIVNSANSLSLSGAGSKSKILIELPDTLRMSDSNILGNTLLLTLSDHSSIFASADVNFSGDWKKSNGVYVTGGYYANLVFDGNVVTIYYDDFDLSEGSISIQAKQGTTSSEFFSVRNNSSRDANFFVSVSFNNAPYSSLVLQPSDEFFSLEPNASNFVNFDLVLSNSANGNYAGIITIIGELNDGVSDYNITKGVFVSIESFEEAGNIVVYPRSTAFSASSPSSSTKYFSVCNIGESNESVSWSADSNIDANMLSWFSIPPNDSNGVINLVSAGTCTDFNLLISVPGGVDSKTYDANITVTYPDTNTYTFYIYTTIS
jgi:hypothetical protein